MVKLSVLLKALKLNAFNLTCTFCANYSVNVTAQSDLNLA